MAPRTTGTASDEFDLTRFLWGDLPLISEPLDAVRYGQIADLPASKNAFPSAGEDRLLTETASLRETSPPWGGTPHGGQEAVVPSTAETDAGEPIDIEDAADEFDAETDSDIDLDALAALAELAEAGFAEDDPAAEELGGEPDDVPLYTRSLSYGELTERLRKEIFPRLRLLAESKGYLTLGHLARAVLDLQGSSNHLDEVRAFIELLNAPVLPSRARPGVRHLPLWATRQAQRRFSDLLRGQIDEHVVIQRFGYEGIQLSRCTRAFLVQAWMCHGLSRAEERDLVSTISAEVTRVGENPKDWSAEAWAAREALVLDNLSLVARMARHYLDSGVEIDDLLQFGALGLFRAVEKFESERVNRFVHYANNWVFQSIKRHIADHSRLIRLPVHVQEHSKDIAEVAAGLYQTLEREPRVAEIAEASATSENVVRAILVTTRPISLDEPRGQAAVVLLTDTEDLAAKAEVDALADSVRAALATLNARERDVLEQRFGLIDGEVRTLEEVGQAYGVTRERIRQIESKAIRLLQLPSRARLLREEDPPRSPRSVLQVPAAAAKTLLPTFSATDQMIIQWLWGLDRRRQRTVQSAATLLRVPARHVQEVSFQVAALHCARLADAVVRPTAIKSRAKERIADGPDQSAKALGVHPGWMLSAVDKSSADWAARLFGHSPTKPTPTTHHVIR